MRVVKKLKGKIIRIEEISEDYGWQRGSDKLVRRYYLVTTEDFWEE